MLDTKAAEKLLPLLQLACKNYPQHAEYPAAIIKVSEQSLYVFKNDECIAQYPVSTSRYGVGQAQESNQTPLGVHSVKEKIGGNAKPGEIFISRQPTNNTAAIEHNAVCTNEECITSRILWLSGMEQGINKGHRPNGVCVDSYERYIYIHGTHEEGLIGQTASIGCIRMKNADVIDLYNLLMISSLVIIAE